MDVVGRQFEPYLTAVCGCMLAAPLWCGLGRCSRTDVVINTTANPPKSSDYSDLTPNLFVHTIYALPSSLARSTRHTNSRAASDCLWQLNVGGAGPALSALTAQTMQTPRAT